MAIRLWRLILCLCLAVSCAVQAGTGSDNPDGNYTTVQKGIKVEFSIDPVPDGTGSVPDGTGSVADDAGSAAALTEGAYADVRFRISDAASGEPISPLEPAVWISRSDSMSARSCQEQISHYLQGILSTQADIDLNKFFILIMNHDRSISVVDPLLGVSGITQLYTMIILDKPGEDWVQSADGRWLYVSMPKASSVAVISLDDFKVRQTIKVGNNPVRLALQPDERYLWVGHDGKTGEENGVSVIDTLSGKVTARIDTGVGHHEIAFSANSLFAYVSNSLSGTVSVIDTQQLRNIQTIEVAGHPVSVQFSGLSQVLYVASENGRIVTIDNASHNIINTLETEPGLVALRMSPDGRWGFVANVKENRVIILDAASGAIAHQLDMEAQPYQFAFTDSYAYVRYLDIAEVMLVPLAQLDQQQGSLGIKKVPLGSIAPGTYSDIALADAIAPTGEWTSIVAANPADKMIYYYMEGMIAPMGSYTTYGRVPRAVRVVDRSVHETARGEYSARIRIPEATNYSVAFLLDSPVVYECFHFTATADPKKPAHAGKRPVQLSFLLDDRNIAVGEDFKLRFSLHESAANTPLSELKDVVVLTTRPPGNWQQRQQARAIDEGLYEVDLKPDQPGIYTISVSIRSLGLDFTRLPHISLRAVPAKASK